MTQSTTPPPFWVDEIEPADIHPHPKSMGRLLRLYSVFIGLTILVVSFSLLYTLNHILAFFLLIISTISWGIGIYRRKIRQKKYLAALEIQENTRQRTGALAIGSAIHVAGHPQLERDQAVVLMLSDSEIRIVDYEGKNLSIIPLHSIESLHTVVYDDERVPHVETIDSTAQALQISFKHGDKIFTALFRRMRKVRPIDWYHSIQKARERSYHSMA